jgi:hypothetical protein
MAAVHTVHAVKLKKLVLLCNCKLHTGSSQCAVYVGKLATQRVMRQTTMGTKTTNTAVQCSANERLAYYTKINMQANTAQKGDASQASSAACSVGY